MADRYYKSCSFPLVAFLYTQNQQIAGVNPTGEGRKMEFSLVTSDYLEELVDLYRFGPKEDERLMINVHKYEQARKELLSLIRD